MKVLSQTFKVTFLFFILTSWIFSAEKKFKRLHIASASATSYLKSNWNKYNENYHPNYAFDENPKTAWVEGEKGHGVSQKLKFDISPLRTVNQFKFRVQNGYQKSKQLFLKNSSIKSFRLDFLHENKQIFSQKLNLKKKMGWQDMIVKVPKKQGVSQISLTILSVYPGTKYKDTCLSDVQIFVDSDVIYSKRIEDNKKKRLISWTKERLKTASYFKSLPLNYPFAATAFKLGDPAAAPQKKWFSEYKKKTKFYINEINQFKKNKQWYTAVIARKLKALPDGLPWDFQPNGFNDFLLRSEVSFFEAKQQNPNFKDMRNYASFSRSQYKVKRYKNNQIKYIYFEMKRYVHSRDASTKFHTGHVFYYAPKGKLLEVFQYEFSSTATHPDFYEGGKDQTSISKGDNTWYKFEFSGKKKINRILRTYTRYYTRYKETSLDTFNAI